MILADALRGAAAAAGLDGQERVAPDGTTWALGETAFAFLREDGSMVAFRLDPVLAAAASRTPDVTISPRGPGWIEFAPAVVDGHALDRATAWFGAAARRAGS